MQTKTRPSPATLGLTVCAIILALAGQWVLLQAKIIPVAIVLYVLALALMLLALPRNEMPTMPISTAQVSPQLQTVWRVAFFVGAVVCTALAFNLNTDQSFKVEGISEYQFTAPGVIAWFASIAFFIAAFFKPEKTAAERADGIRTRLEAWRGGFSIRLRWTTLALIAILALGAVSYFYRLDATPAEMTSDHAEKLTDVNDILEGNTPLFFIRNTGREPLQFYLTFLVIRVFGFPLGHIALKTGTALIGFLTIPATWLIAREMFDEVVGLFAAFFVSIMHWAMAISRMGLRYPFTPFFAALSIYFLWRALKYQKRNDYLMAGLVLGVGLYGYIPSRSVPLVAVGLCVLWFLVGGWNRVGWRPFAVNVGLMLALVVVVSAPLFRYSLDFPDMFWYRALTRVASVETPIQGNILAIFAQNLVNLALAFNWRGEEVWVTNVPYDPSLDLISAALLVLGVALAIYRAVQDRAANYLCLLAAFATLLAPSALAFAFPRENPSFVRMGGAIPFAAILLALPVAVLWRALRQSLARLEAGAALSVVGVGILLAPIVGLNYQRYFVDYDLSYRLSAQNSSEVAAVIRNFAGSVGDLQHAYFIGYPYWLDGRAVAINIGDIKWKNYSLDATDFIQDATTNLLFILHPDDKANLQILMTQFPQGQEKIIQSRTPGKDFVSFFVPMRPLENKGESP